MPAWVVMWTIAVAIFGAAKIGTWWPARERVTIGYLVAWPGMDPRAFTPGQREASRFEWGAAVTKLSLGLLLLFGVARLVPNPLAQAWVGGVGLVLFLHFGVFHLLALAWGVQPIMRKPLQAASLGEFWGRRWNVAFHELALRLVFDRLRPRIGATGSVLATFLASGLIHDLVISIPARGGYGLPTLYFLLQGAAVIAERRLRLQPGTMGHLRVALVVGLPALILFHPWFMVGVMLPFMKAIGAV